MRAITELFKSCLLSTILFIMGILIKSIVLMFLWNWYIFPVINVEITFLKSIGIMFTAMFFMQEVKYKTSVMDEERHYREIRMRFYDVFFHCLAYLFVGYIIYNFL